jgi:hypothetical protein
MEMGEVVETSFHPINGMHGKYGHGGRVSMQSPLVNGFLCKGYNDRIFRLTEECKCILIEEDADTEP